MVQAVDESRYGRTQSASEQGQQGFLRNRAFDSEAFSPALRVKGFNSCHISLTTALAIGRVRLSVCLSVCFHSIF